LFNLFKLKLSFPFAKKKGKPTCWFTLYYTLSLSGVNAEKELPR